MMFKIILSIGLLACYSIAKSVDLPSDNQVDPSTKDVEDPDVPDLSEVIREVENIQETFLRKLSEEMQKIDSKLQKIRDRHEEEMKHTEKEPTATKEGEKKMPEQEGDSKMPTGQSEEDLRKEDEPKLTEEQQMPEKMENLPKETTIQVKEEPENVIIEVRVPEFTKPEEKAPVEEPLPDLGVKELGEDFTSTTQKSLEKIIEEVIEQLQPEDKLPKMESGEEKEEQESEEKPIEEEEKKKVSSSESSESSEEKSDLITAPSGASIIISVPAEYQEEGNVNIEVIPREGQEFLNPQPEDLRLAEGKTEAPSTEAASTEVSTTEVSTTEVPTTEVPTTEVPTTEVTVAELTTQPLEKEMTTEVPSQTETTAAQVPREEFTTEAITAETTTLREKESSTEGSKLLLPGNTIIISLSTDLPQPEEKEIVIDIEIPKRPCLDEKLSDKPTEEQTPEPTTSRPAKTTRRPTEGKKRLSGKRCPIGYQFNIYTLECTIQPNYASNYATGFGTYYWSMSQSPSSLTQNNPFVNLFGLRK